MRRFKIVLCSVTMFFLACGALLAVTPIANANATLNSNEDLVLLSSNPTAILVAFSTSLLYVDARDKPTILSQVPADFALLALKPAVDNMRTPTSPAVVICGAANSPSVADDVAIYATSYYPYSGTAEKWRLTILKAHSLVAGSNGSSNGCGSSVLLL